VEKNPLDEAESLYRRRRWAELIGLLEPLSPMYRDHKRFCFLLATAYLYREDIGGAYSYYRRAQHLDFRDTGAAAGLAAVLIRRGESDKAIQLYIEVLEREARNPIARKGMAYLRAHASGDGDTGHGKALRALYPRPPYRARVPLAIGLALALLSLAVWAAPRMALELRNARPSRPSIAAIVLEAEERASPIDSSGGFSFVLSEKEAVESFDKAKRLFLEYRDEAALVELNRLRLSNASRGVKAKADALAAYAREPSFQSMPDRFSIADVNAFPVLYEGVGVLWKGLPANIEQAQDSTSFELLVGYHDKRRLEGIVLVRLPFAAAIDPNTAIEVLARVRKPADGAQGYYLSGIAIHSF
jgi:tetratricopeptide (TPR) repeat protein